MKVLLNVATGSDAAYSALGSITAAELFNEDDDIGSGYNLRTTLNAEGVPFYLAHSFYHAMITFLSDRTDYQKPGDFEWRIVPGLANPNDPSLVSLISPSFPGRYLRIDSNDSNRYPNKGEASNYNTEAFLTPENERNHLGWLDEYKDTDTFKKDATFRIVPARNGDLTMVSFQWYQNSLRYLGHKNFQIHALVLDGSKEQNASASFALEPLGFLVATRADPHILYHSDGYYYLTATVPEYDRIEIRRAATLRGLAAAEPKVIWKKHTTGEMGAHIWAPELHHINGKWYVYFAAGSAQDVWKIRMYVLESSSANPLDGSWIEKGKIQTPWESFSLDATTFEHQGTRYLIWAQSDPSLSNNSCLFIAAMSNPWTIEGTPVRIAMPEYQWEKEGYSVNEGPAVLIRNGRVFVSYSASATDERYAIGLLTADATANLLDASSWTKNATPVFSSTNTLFGPGHNSFTTSKDGSIDILVYHARNYTGLVGSDALEDRNRHTRVQRLNWNEDGTPNFGEPLVNGFETIRE